MIRIGCVDIDTSHPRAFAEILRKNGRARYCAVYNNGFRNEAEVKGFMRMNDIAERSLDLEEMVEQVDVGFIHSCNWDKHLSYAEAFVKANKPVFIDKPIVGNMRDVAKLREYAKSDALILGSSCMRYSKTVTDFLSMPVEDRGEIVSIHSICGVDEFNYAIHAVEAIGGLVPRGAMLCQFTGGGSFGQIRNENYAIQYSNGITATYSLTYGQWQRSIVQVLTTRNTYTLELNGYEPLLDLVISSVENGRRETAPVDDILESIMIMFAGKISREQKGRQVFLSEIPEDYPGFDGAAFERTYAANASLLYSV